MNTTTNIGIVLSAADRTQAAFNSVSQRIDRMQSGLARAVSAAASLAAPAAAATAAIGAAAGATFAFASRQADAIAKYQELSDKVGDAAEQIASLQPAADLSGVSLDTIAASSIKLTAAMSKTDDEAKGVGAAIKALGLDFDRFKQLKPVEQMDTLAQAFNRFEDGAGKTATAVALFGKSGAEMLPFFKDLAEQGERQIRLTSEQIEAADKFSKQMARLRSDLSLVSQEIAGPLITSFNDLIDNFKLARKEGLGFWAAMDRASQADAARFWGFDKAAEDLKRLRGELALVDASLSRPGNQMQQQRVADLEKRRSLLVQIARIEADRSTGNESAAESARLGRRNVLTPPKTPDKTPKSPKDDPIERYLENLQRQLQLTQDLTVEEKLLADIQAGRLGKVTEGQQRELQSIAAQIDAARERAEQVKTNRQAFLENYDATTGAELKVEEERRARINALIEATPTARLEAQRKVMDELADAYERGELGLVGSAEAMAKYEEAANTFLGNVPPQIEKMDGFLQKFAENVQDTLGDGLYDLMSGNFDNIGDRFLQMINRMIADAAAADLAKWLLGDMVKGGTGEGVFGSIIKSVGGSIFLPSAKGNVFNSPALSAYSGRIVDKPTLFPFAKGIGLMGEAGAEAILPLKRGRDGRLGVEADGGQRQINHITFSIQGPVDRRSEATLAKAATRALQRAQRWM